ncbi:nucleoredoxin-like protein 2 [Plakobranchus ocellatus]|uniref:Nucleoredoxin-like protein 2 n=1 Tax=Plakobranchus ocellatus TaxID=259542 RepID=A0AAV4DVC2_9GAST|nr:nucleoredoxin-like protein 2 [Plakobranchus ocellatus]
MAELLKDIRLLNKKWFSFEGNIKQEQGTVSGEEALIGKVVCLFFSAAWCTPCQHFVPMLKEVYTELKNRGEALEVVFLSFDKTEEEMMAYYEHQHGDWLALKFSDPLKK